MFIFISKYTKLSERQRLTSEDPPGYATAVNYMVHLIVALSFRLWDASKSLVILQKLKAYENMPTGFILIGINSPFNLIQT